MPIMNDMKPALSRRRVLKGAGAVAAGVAAPAILNIRSAMAAYPDRPVKIIVANTPGGPSDITARMLTASLQQSTGKTFIVENIGGAGGNIGMANAANSPAGWLHFPAGDQRLFGECEPLQQDPLRSGERLRRRQRTRDLAEYIRGAIHRCQPRPSRNSSRSRRRADKFNASCPPIGTAPQLQLEVFKQEAKLPKLEAVVFKGGGDALQALLSGTVQLSSGSLPPAAPHIKAGTLRCLAVTGDTRWPELPNVPTMVEEGFKDFVFATDMVLLAPAKTPPDAVKWLEAETLKVLNTAEMKDKMLQGRLPGAAQRAPTRRGSA